MTEGTSLFATSHQVDALLSRGVATRRLLLQEPTPVFAPGVWTCPERRTSGLDGTCAVSTSYNRIHYTNKCTSVCFCYYTCPLQELGH